MVLGFTSFCFLRIINIHCISKIHFSILQKSDWVELNQNGVVHTFTIAGWSGKTSLKRLPFVLAYVIVDGCKMSIANELRGIDSWDAEFGMPVKVVWADKKGRRGTVTNWWFEPADGWKPSGMNPEKERMKEMCAPVYEWVKIMNQIQFW